MDPKVIRKIGDLQKEFINREQSILNLSKYKINFVAIGTIGETLQFNLFSWQIGTTKNKLSSFLAGYKND